MGTPAIAVSSATNRALMDERRLKKERKALYGTIEEPQPDAEILPTDHLALAPMMGGGEAGAKLIGNLGKRLLSIAHKEGEEAVTMAALKSGAGREYLMRVSKLLTDLMTTEGLKKTEMEALDKAATGVRRAVFEMGWGVFANDPKAIISVAGKRGGRF